MGKIVRILIFSFYLYGSSAYAQQMNWSRLTEDTVYYATEYLPDHFDITPPGPGQSWDLRSLRAPYALSRRIIPSGEKNNVTYGHLMNGKQAEAILELKGKNALVIQYIRDNPLCPGGKLNFNVSPGRRQFFHGIFGASTTYQGKMQSTFAWPRNIVCSWKPAELPDSCRITYNISEEITVDGDGVLYLPSEINNVYRHHVEEKTTILIETLKGNKWEDVTVRIPGIQMIRFKELHRFVSADTGLPLAEVEIGEDMEVHRVEFKTHPLMTRIINEEPSRPDIFAYPNPSFDIVRFQTTELRYGKYKLKIFNILGVLVREMEFQVDHPRETVSMDLSTLQRGTYLCRLQDSFGRTVRTKKVVLIQP